jgi:hypothetical protein
MFLLCKNMFPSGRKILYVQKGQASPVAAFIFLTECITARYKGPTCCFTKIEMNSLDYARFIQSNKVWSSVRGVTKELIVGSILVGNILKVPCSLGTCIYRDNAGHCSKKPRFYYYYLFFFFLSYTALGSEKFPSPFSYRLITRL